jgi:tRNA-dihydrouridine synthase
MQPFAAAVKMASGIAVQAVGMIVDPHQAEAIVADDSADCVALARGCLDDPRWAWHAADMLGADVEYPRQYRRARPDQWPGAALARPNRALEWQGAGLSAAFVERPGQVARGGEQSRRPSQFNASDGGGMRTVGRDRQ